MKIKMGPGQEAYRGDNSGCECDDKVRVLFVLASSEVQPRSLRSYIAII
jgi:hypothetical protein